MLEVRQPLENRARGGDRVAPVEKRPLGQLRRGYKSKHRGLVAHQHAIGSRRELSLADLEAAGKDLDRVGVIVAGGQGLLVGLEDLFHLAEFFRHQPEGGIERTIVHPQHDAKGEHVLAAAGELVADSRILDRLEGETREGHGVNIVAFEGAGLARIFLVARLLEVVLTEGV